MHKIRGFLMIAALAVALACSDGSPTSPAAQEKAAAAASTEDVRASLIRPARGPRARAVVSARKDRFLPPGVWGSSQASLTIRESGATLKIFALAVPPDGCYGSYGDVLQGIPNGSFSLSGIFTQLTGVYPGKIEYPAQFTGVVEGTTMSISISVPSLTQTLGPFVLTSGVTNTWGPCLYP
jgi:hypothetical protein